MTEEGRVKVKLIGEMGRRFGREYEFYARNAKEVIRAFLIRSMDFRSTCTRLMKTIWASR